MHPECAYLIKPPLQCIVKKKNEDIWKFYDADVENDGDGLKAICSSTMENASLTLAKVYHNSLNQFTEARLAMISIRILRAFLSETIRSFWNKIKDRYNVD